jgi:hypothetical protein
VKRIISAIGSFLENEFVEPFSYFNSRINAPDPFLAETPASRPAVRRGEQPVVREKSSLSSILLHAPLVYWP